MSEKANEYWSMECPCCGDIAAYGKDGELVYDGQPLDCGCQGHISVDSESEPFVNAYDCECDQNDRTT